jgi:uncharacterized protein DUF4442
MFFLIVLAFCPILFVTETSGTVTKSVAAIFAERQNLVGNDYWLSIQCDHNPRQERLSIDVEMKLRFWNRNYVGTHFGGSLYSMTDPFYMLMLIENLGRDYIVWDKSAAIRFKRPGRGKVLAAFRLSDEQIEGIRQALTTQEKVEPEFMVEVRDETGAVVAEVQKVLHVRKK